MGPDSPREMFQSPSAAFRAAEDLHQSFRINLHTITSREPSHSPQSPRSPQTKTTTRGGEV